MKWRTSDGQYEVEDVVINNLPRLRVRLLTGGHTYLVGYYRTPDEMAEAVQLDLADLKVVDE